MATLQEIQKFISFLGYAPDESVFFRLISPKDFDKNNSIHRSIFPQIVYDRDGSTTVRKTNIKWDQAKGTVEGYEGKVISKNIAEYLNRQNSIGMAVYIVVNPGGQKIENITEARVIYYENDEHSIPDQIAKFSELNTQWGGGFAVQTKNSVHSYFRLDKILTPQEFTATQKRLIKFIEGSDDCIHDPSRVMRVPGFDHIQMIDNEAVRTPIKMIQDWDGTFSSFSQIDSELPTIKAETKKEFASDKVTTRTRTRITTDSTNNFMKPSLSLFISIDNRCAILDGVPVGTRNTTAKRLACDLIGTARKLAEFNISTCDTAEELYEQYSLHCDTAKEGELEGIWFKTLEENPSPCLDDDKLKTNLGAFYVREVTNSDTSDINNTPKNNISPVLQNNNRYQSILSEELDEVIPEEITEKFFKPSEHKNCWNDCKGSLPDEIVKIIEYFSGKTGVPKEAYALAFLTQVSGIITGKYFVDIAAKWMEPLNLFFVLIGEKGFNKSSVLSLFGDFQTTLNKQYHDDFITLNQQYKRDMTQWNAQKKHDDTFDGEEPIEPSQRVGSISKITLAKLTAQLKVQADFNNAGFCQQADELTSIMGNPDGKGQSPEISALLSIHSGKELTSATKTDGFEGVYKTRMSILATTQPKTYQTLMSTYSDENGLDDRLLLALITHKDTKPFDHTNRTAEPFEIDQFMIGLVALYEKNQGVTAIKFTPQAQVFSNEIEKWAHQDISKYAKPKAHVYRIAGIFAALRNATNPLITVADLKAAFSLVLYSEACRSELLGNQESSETEKLIAKTIKLLEKKGSIDINSLSSFDHSMRNSSKEDRTKMLNKVANILGDRVEVTFKSTGTPVLTLIDESIKAVVTPQSILSQPVTESPVTTQEVVQEVITDVIEISTELPVAKTVIDNVQSEDSQKEAILDESDESIEWVYIPDENLPDRCKGQFTESKLYKVVSKNNTFVSVYVSPKNPKVNVLIALVKPQNDAINTSQSTDDPTDF